MTPGRGARGRPWTRWLAALLVVTWLAAFTATHLPKEAVPEIPATDWTLHLVGYFVLAGLFAGALTACGVRRARRAALAVSVFAAYAAFDEITQPLVNRHASVHDWLADLIGVVLALAAWEVAVAVWQRRSRARQRPG